MSNLQGDKGNSNGPPHSGLRICPFWSVCSGLRTAERHMSSFGPFAGAAASNQLPHLTEGRCP